VTSVVRKVLGSRDPAVCSKLVTARYLRQAGFPGGARARRACAAALNAGEPALSVSISGVDVHKGRAETHVVLKGGDDDGQTLDLALIRVADQWKVDRIRAVKLNFRRFLAAGRRSLVRLPAGLTRRQAKCATNRIRALGKAAVQRAIVSGNHGPVTKAILACPGLRSVRSNFERVLRRWLAARGFAGNRIDCVIRRLRAALTVERIRADDRRVRAGKPLSRGFVAAMQRAGFACAR
jgi:hypothetical protein